jgi:hypothetical protein
VRSYDGKVAMWACPHCGAPQAEAARCWVCHRSSTTCSTCRHFRTSLAADVGYCGKDRWRAPLTGLELRACWEEGRRSVAVGGATDAAGGSSDATEGHRNGAVARGDGGPLDRPNPMRLRGFVPLDELMPPTKTVEPSVSAPVVASIQPTVIAEPADRWAGRTNLFGDAEG